MNSSYPAFECPVCPVPLGHKDQIVIGHGSGGRMSHELIQRVFVSNYNNEALSAGNDFGVSKIPPQAQLLGKLVVSTDAHIVSPLFFPGGDIGRLAICGTVNDIAMSGGIPLSLSASFIIEEGLDIPVLVEVANSMKIAAQEAGVEIIAGDTKVVEKGKADRLFISTAGVGWVRPGLTIGGDQAQPGDAVLISGTIGDHGIAVLAARNELGFQTSVRSDVAPLNHLIQSILSVAPSTHVLRDPTRGGVATTLNEIAIQSKVNILIEENSLPIQTPVKAACEMLGFDPLYVANEGKLIVFVSENETDAALEAMRQHPLGSNACKIGTVQAENTPRVLLHTLIGGTRILDMLSGEMLPRIC